MLHPRVGRHLGALWLPLVLLGCSRPEAPDLESLREGFPRQAAALFDGESAFAPRGARLRPRLSARGRRIELAIDTHGEAAWIDPQWISAGMLSEPRMDFPAVSLQDGRVLASGGRAGFATITSGVELYDRAT